MGRQNLIWFYQVWFCSCVCVDVSLKHFYYPRKEEYKVAANTASAPALISRNCDARLSFWNKMVSCKTTKIKSVSIRFRDMEVLINNCSKFSSVRNVSQSQVLETKYKRNLRLNSFYRIEFGLLRYGVKHQPKKVSKSIQNHLQK